MTDSAAISSEVPRRNRWLPTIGLSIWLIFVLGLSLSQWRLVMINADGDPCLHWRIGHWMIEHRAVLRSDVFSHTRMGQPLISKEWLGEVLFAAAGDALGWNGIVLLAAALIATCLWLLHRELLLEGNDLVFSTGLTLAAAMACSVHWLARPHLFTHLLTVVFTWQLRLFDQGKLSTRKLLLRLVPLMALWANLHGAFFTGFVIMATFLAGNSLSLIASRGDARPVLRRKLRGLALLAVAGALATLLNPNGWKLTAQVVQFLHDPVLASYTNEFRSPNFHADGAHGLLVELALVALTLVVLRPSLGATDIMVIGTWGLLALLAARNVPIFALVITPILAECWRASLTKANTGRWADLYRRFSAQVTTRNRSADGRATVALAVIVLLAIATRSTMTGANPIVVTDVLSNRFPVAGVQFVAANPNAIDDEMFNDYGWGGYLMLALPERRVFVDGRNDFYGAELIREFDGINKARHDWEGILRKYNVGWTILPRDHPLNVLLGLRKEWSLAYADDVAAIYRRKPE